MPKKFGTYTSRIFSPPGRGAIAAWTFEDGSGSTLKDIVGNHDGTLQNMEDADWKTSGVRYLGNCLDFDGTNEFVEIPDSSDFTFIDSVAYANPFSISAWINMDSATDFQILSKSTASNHEWQFQLSSADKLQLRIFSLDGVAYRGRRYDTALSTGQWYHVVATYDGRGGTGAAGGIDIYIDGVRRDNTSISSGTYTAMTGGTAPVYIGRQESIHANGKIAQVVIYGYELSAAEIYGLNRFYGMKMYRRTMKVKLKPMPTIKKRPASKKR